MHDNGRTNLADKQPHGQSCTFRAPDTHNAMESAVQTDHQMLKLAGNVGRATPCTFAQDRIIRDRQTLT
jgi:hypothetical protein